MEAKPPYAKGRRSIFLCWLAKELLIGHNTNVLFTTRLPFFLYNNIKDRTLIYLNDYIKFIFRKIDQSFLVDWLLNPSTNQNSGLESRRERTKTEI